MALICGHKMYNAMSSVAILIGYIGYVMALICGHKMYNAMSRQSSLCFVGKLFFRVKKR